ncbi:NAD(P)H-dependent flavin oxidoreductase [Rivibacter subsaxonicus]|uniref:Nitronate monooxygenase n=1 Tax=Rivibacter subsaxonicus TaxID=457575 RepID=A0A4Q7W0D8_9BURK|nr:nitronate monooxygenase [Rivibacter subsaxonicus]RZU02463.1 nitronate monooxygenase [Rivibacter subsaxonicus]
MQTRLTEMLGIEHPILSAPMGVAAGGKLAAAVSAAGGLGLIGGGYGDAAWLEREFAAAGTARVGCGFITWSLAQKPQLLDLVLAQTPVAVMLSFGELAPFAPRIKAAGARLMCQVQTLALAREAVAAGADVIVAQGAEAGGHGLARATFTLVPEIADYLAGAAPDTVLVAAGGVADGRGLAAALMLGADGVLVGTRFWASSEALVAPSLQAAAVAADGDSTVRTTVPDVARRYHWPGSFTARAIRSRFVDDWHGRESVLAEPGTLEREEARYWQGFHAGDPDNTCMLAGEAVGLMHDVAPAGDIVQRMTREAQALLARAAGTRARVA